MQNVKNMKTFYHDGICPVRDILSHIGSKWSVLILISLNANGKMRFSDIQRSLGDISQFPQELSMNCHKKGKVLYPC